MSRTSSERPFVVLKVPSPAPLLRAEVGSITARRALAAEVLGTLLLTFFAVGVLVVTGGILGEKLSSASLLVTSVAHGLAFGLLVSAAVAISGGHLNPILTVAAMVAGRMTVTRGLTYLAAQLVGAVAGGILLKLALPPGAPLALGVPALGPRVTPEAGLLIEGTLAFTLTAVFLATAGRGLAGLTPLALGLTTVLGRLFGAALTGAPMNPALAFGVSLTAGVWTSHWVWWLGPLIGSALAAASWRRWVPEGPDLGTLMPGPVRGE